MRNSSFLGCIGLIMAVANFIFGKASDIQWLIVFLVLCTSFIVEALEDLKGPR